MTGLAVSPDGAQVYTVAGSGWAGSSVAILDRDLETGRLTFRSCLGTQAGCDGDRRILMGAALVASADGRHLYSSGLELARDPADGALRLARCDTQGYPQVAGCDQGGGGRNGLVLTSGGLHGYFGDGSRYPRVVDRDPATGALADRPCAPAGERCESNFPAQTGPIRFAVAPGDLDVYGAGIASPFTPGVPGTLFAYRRDAASGTLAATQCFGGDHPGLDCIDTPLVGNADAIAVAGDGHAVYLASGGNNAGIGTLGVFARDPKTGRLSESGCISQSGSGGACVQGLAIGTARQIAASPDGRNVYVGGLGGRLAVLGTAVGLARPRLAVSRAGAARALLVCPRAGRVRCRGGVAIRARGRTVGRRRFSIARGRSARVAVKLSGRARRSIHRRGRLRAELATRARGAVSGRMLRRVTLVRRAPSRR